MSAAIENENRSTVVVIYDDPATRARALSACDYLVSQLWDNVELDFYWWRTDFLSDSNMSRAAAHYAIGADFLIVCSTGNESLSNTLENWFESWISERNKPEGALIDLSPVSGIPNLARLQSVLRKTARQGNFDYLASHETEFSTSDRSPRGLSSVLPASADQLLDHSRPPARFGLNE